MNMVSTDPLEIVHLEESDLDAEIVRDELRSRGVAARVVRVHDERDFRTQLARPEVDVILADRESSGWDGFVALSIAREQRPEVPFIFVSGKMEPREGIESLNAGATDFVQKQYLNKLAPAIRRSLEESRAQAELQRARDNLTEQAELLDLANDSIILCDPDGTITYWNHGSRRIYGWSAEEAVGKNVHELLQTKFQHGARDPVEILRKETHWEGELQQLRHDGTSIEVASHWTTKHARKNSALLQINSDITARHHAEHALRESEERYRRFVDEDFTGNLMMRSDGAIVTCNPAFARIFGFSSMEEAMNCNFMSLLRTRKDGAELISKIREHGAIERHEIEMRQPSGEAVYAVARLVGTFDERGELTQVQGHLFNDTKRKRLEQQLVQAQKMEGLGTLAGGIAHDFNNILAIILGYTNQLEKRSTQPEQIPVATKVIREAVERGAALVQQLLTSARQTEARLASIDLNGLVRELQGMLRATFPKTINFELRLHAELPVITADRSQIHQVLLNLCVNARDAMPHGGTITLKTFVTAGAELEESFTGADAESYACIRVRDTGAGMTPEVKAHIFEPFFTTKERAKGTGLGLSVVYGVVNNHRGFVQVESEQHVGTTFNIYLPLSLPKGPLAGGAAAETPRTVWEPQTILLVEDEEMLRDLGVEILQGEGYRVLAAKDGVEAVEIFSANRDAIGLVVCDLGLPRMGGRDVIMKLKELKPSMRALVVSGYLEPAQRSEILKAGVIDTIQKPYDFRDLVARIQSVIGKSHSDDDHPQLF